MQGTPERSSASVPVLAFVCAHMCVHAHTHTRAHLQTVWTRTQFGLHAVWEGVWREGVCTLLAGKRPPVLLVEWGGSQASSPSSLRCLAAGGDWVYTVPSFICPPTCLKLRAPGISATHITGLTVPAGVGAGCCSKLFWTNVHRFSNQRHLAEGSHWNFSILFLIVIHYFFWNFFENLCSAPTYAANSPTANVRRAKHPRDGGKEKVRGN